MPHQHIIGYSVPCKLHQNYDVCLKVKRDYQNCSVLCWIQQLFTTICTHTAALTA